jgi:hypothetical protein
MKQDNTPIDPTWMEKTGGYARDMTLRDYYAGRAMQGILTATLTPNTVWSRDEAAETAYNVADAMLKAREAK